MPLEAGTRLGPYEIVAPAGAGGMGEVYRARDTRLGRDVAIKILSAELAASPEFRQRFDREARSISALSHAHICALFDVGHQNGVDFLVMEYLEGQTLAERLTCGALPPDQVLRCGIEISDALESAHRKGIVHRDLKPGNIMLTRAGARLLDFGLAKPVAFNARSGSTVAATLSSPLTAGGSLVGTFQYMSPEQVEGKEADTRSDIFALGAVLYEMATGRRAFDGKTTASVIAAILEREPPAVSSLQPLAPEALDDLVRGCLAKDPDERWQTAHDVRLQLQALRQREAGPARTAVPVRRGSREAIAWGAAILALIASIAFGLAYTLKPPPPAPLLRASLLPPAVHSFAPNGFAVAPDGRRIAFVATGANGVSTLWVNALDSAQPAAISGTEGAASPFWSADSRWVAFFARGKLMKVEPGGTGLQAICDAGPFASVGAWNRDGRILFHGEVVGPLLGVDANGGTAAPVTSIPGDTPGEAHRFPQFLPDGRRFLYVASWTNLQRGGLYLASLNGHAPKLVSSEIRSRMLLVGDELLFVRDGTLYAQLFDAGSGELTGAPRAVLRNEIVTDWRFGDTPMSASLTGVLVFQSRLAYNSRLVWYDRSGRELGTVGSPGLAAPALSPDGRRVAATFDRAGSGQENLWVHDLQRDVASQLTVEGIDTAHSWSPDGRWLAYSSIRGTNGLYRRPADGSGKEETLVESPAHLLINDWSPDGRRLVYMDFSTGNVQLQTYDTQTRQSERAEPASAEASYSPDGRWLAFVTMNGTLHVAAVGHDGGRVQISSGPGSQARWRADGKEIFYIRADRKMMAVSTTERNGRLDPGNPMPLFQTRIIKPNFVLFQYDVSADGQRFLINSLPREDAAAPLTMLVNWREELKR